MNNFLPSKKFGLIILSLCVVAGLVFGAWNLAETKKNTNTAVINTETGKEVVVTQFEKDSDSDGLKDWEEALWKTEPNKPDTDGDGIKDGDEIKQNKNPLIKGPNDKLFTTEGTLADNTKTSSTTAAIIPKNETEKMAENFYLSYFAYKNQKGSLSTTDKESVVGQIMDLSNPLLKNKLTYTEFSAVDIKAKEDESRNSYMTYYMALFQAINSGTLPKDQESESVIVQKALNDEQPNELKKLDPIIAAYTKIENYLQGLAVPKVAVPLHLELLNSVSGMEQTITYMRNNYENPVAIVYAVDDYQKFLDRMTSAINNFKLLAQKL